MSKIVQITKDTAIPLGLVILLLGGAAGVGAAYNAIAGQEKRIEEIQVDNKELVNRLTSIDNRLSTIEGVLKIRRR